jgi:hypothetical protein
MVDPGEGIEESPEEQPEPARTRQTRAARPGGGPRKTPPAPAAAAAEVDARRFSWDGAEDFWDWLSGFSSNDWNHLIGYLWRVSPITDRKFAGKASSIQKYASRFDLERIMLDHGSGGYRLDFCYTNPTTTKQNRIAQHYFQIMNMNYPPKVPMGDWLNDPENETWRWAEPALRKQQSQAAAAVDGENNGGLNANALAESIFRGVERIRGEQADNASVTTQLIDMMKDNADQLREATNPVTQLSTLTTLMEKLAPKTNSSDQMFTFMTKQLEMTQTELKEMRLLLMNRPAEKDTITTLLDNLPKIKEAAESLGLKATRGAAGASGTDWGDVALKIGQQLLAVVPQFISYHQWNEQRKEAAAKGQPAPPPPPVQTAPPGIAPPPGVTTAAGMPDEFSEEEKQAMMAAFAKYGALLNEVGPILQDHFTAGLTGYELRDWFLDRKGVQQWRELRKDISVKTMVQLSQLSPVLKEKLQPVERLEKFLEQFFTEPGQEPEGAVLTELDDDEEDIESNTEPITK